MHHKVLLTLLTLLTVAHSAEIKTCRAVNKCIAAINSGKRCPLLPVPRRTILMPLPPSGFLLEPLRRSVHGYFDLAYRALIIYRNRRLTLIDFPDSASSITPSGEYLFITAITRVLSGEVPRRVDMVYSHRHTDHIGRAGMVKRHLEDSYPGVKLFVWGTAGLRDFLKERKITRIPEPNVIVGNSGRTIDIAPRLKINLSIVGGHSFDDLACHILPSKNGPGILFYVDVVSPDQPPFIDFGLTPDLFGTIEAQKEVLKLDWKTFAGGHGRLGRKFDVRRNIRYITSVITAIEEAVTEVDPARLVRINRLVTNPEAVQFANGIWTIISTLNLFIDICVKKTIERWGCRLTAVDLLAPSHCRVAALVALTEN